jgi:AraC-like DNA-binding protein
LEASLAQELPTSPYHVALELGFVDVSSLVRKFPGLCRAIQEKIDNHKALRIAAMGRVLTAALTEEPPPSLGELCERLEYSRPIVLRRQFDGLCDELLERRRKYRLDQIEKLRQQLLELSLEFPAVSLEQACRRVGLSRQQLIRLCPEESAAIVAHYDRSCREDTQQRVEELHRQARQIVWRLHLEGKCPSFKRVLALLGKSTSQNWRARTAAIRAAKAELNDGSSCSGDGGLKDSRAESP